MAEMVTVSLLQPQGFKASGDAEVVRYPMGIVEMPLEHARAMGLLHRIRSVKSADDGTQTVEVLPFDGVFDDNLASILQGAGYKTIAELGKASQDELLSIDGIGPANYERIISAVKGV